jgi:hypothetical protein
LSFWRCCIQTFLTWETELCRDELTITRSQPPFGRRFHVHASARRWLAQNVSLVSTTCRIFVFGIVSGLTWSCVPGVLSELFRSAGETATVIVSGVLTGVLISFALGAALRRSRLGEALLLGIAALPLGAFAFGVCLSLVHWVVRQFTGMAYRFADPFAPIMAGAQYAILGVVTVFAFILFPMAVCTTLLLRRVVRAGQES